jgi:hypothetical protein
LTRTALIITNPSVDYMLKGSSPYDQIKGVMGDSLCPPPLHAMVFAKPVNNISAEANNHAVPGIGTGAI